MIFLNFLNNKSYLIYRIYQIYPILSKLIFILILFPNMIFSKLKIFLNFLNKFLSIESASFWKSQVDPTLQIYPYKLSLVQKWLFFANTIYSDDISWKYRENIHWSLWETIYTIYFKFWFATIYTILTHLPSTRNWRYFSKFDDIFNLVTLPNNIYMIFSHLFSFRN